MMDQVNKDVAMVRDRQLLPSFSRESDEQMGFGDDDGAVGATRMESD